jgi:hypothetical protein
VPEPEEFSTPDAALLALRALVLPLTEPPVAPAVALPVALELPLKPVPPVVCVPCAGLVCPDELVSSPLRVLPPVPPETEAEPLAEVVPEAVLLYGRVAVEFVPVLPDVPVLPEVVPEVWATRVPLASRPVTEIKET